MKGKKKGDFLRSQRGIREEIKDEKRLKEEKIKKNRRVISRVAKDKGKL